MSRRGKRFTSRKDEVLRALKANRKKGLQAAAIEIAGKAKKRTPVDTGRLRASIAWAVDGQQRQHSGTVTGSDGSITVSYGVDAPPGTALVGTNVEYAAAVHEGINTQTVKTKAGQTRQLFARQHITGHKFIESAARENKERSLDLIRRGLRGEL